MDSVDTHKIQETVIHKTDLHFFRYCQDNFGINRGVYNTIEQWFYNNGVLNVEDRRKYVLRFLKFVYGDKKGSGKFGKEGLVSKLHRFWSRLKEDINSDYINENKKSIT